MESTWTGIKMGNQDSITPSTLCTTTTRDIQEGQNINNESMIVRTTIWLESSNLTLKIELDKEVHNSI